MMTKWIVGMMLGASACVSGPDVVAPKTMEEEAAVAAAAASDFLVKGFDMLPENGECYDFVGKVMSENGKFIGSCVLIDSNVVLTAAHCVLPTDPIMFRFGDRDVKPRAIFFCPHMKVKPRIPFVDQQIVGDLAIVELQADVPTTTLPILNEDAYHVKTYEEVRMVGFGGGIKKMTKTESLYTSGITVDAPENIPLYPHFAKVWYGDSGGALFSDDGELSGIIYRLVITSEHETLVEFSATNIGYYSHWIELTRKVIRQTNNR